MCLDLPLRFSLTDNATAILVTAIVVDDWHDLVYVAWSNKISVFDAVGQHRREFGNGVEFTARGISGLALSAFPHDVLCVLDAKSLYLLSLTGELLCSTTLIAEKAITDDDVLGQGADELTCLCVDPITSRLFVGTYGGEIRLLPSTAELINSSGAVSWEWTIALPTTGPVLGIAFSPFQSWLYATSDQGELHRFQFSKALMTRAADSLTDEEKESVTSAPLDVRNSLYVPRGAQDHLAAPRALCIETRASSLYVCESKSVLEFNHNSLLVNMFDGKSRACALAVHERRRILYSIVDGHVHVAEIATSARRMTAELLSDLATVAPKLATGSVATRSVGFDASLFASVKKDASAGIASAVYNMHFFVDQRGQHDSSVERVRLLPAQPSFGPYYLYKLASATSEAEARLCAAGLAQAEYFDDYAEAESGFALHLPYMLHAFDRGALWATIFAARLALTDGFVLKQQAHRVLRSAASRGQGNAIYILALSLLTSFDLEEQREGFQLCARAAQV